MTRGKVAAGAFGALLVVLALAAAYRVLEQGAAPARLASVTDSTAAVHEGLLYGRVTTDYGASYEGRLRFGGDEEALWGSYFNALRSESPWAAYAPTERRSIGAFGVDIARWEGPVDLSRPFMARFGDLARVERDFRDIRVTLKGGTVFVLDRMSADDLGDGLRVWDVSQGVVDLVEGQIHTIEFFPSPRLGTAPDPLHGTVRTPQGDFTGLIEWNREAYVGSDELHGLGAEGRVGLRFDAIRSVERGVRAASSVTLLDGREITLSDTDGDRGLYVDDARYGRVLVPWDVLERVDFSPGGTGPAYDDFPAGGPLTGSVVTRSGRRLAGRLVFDLDESETTETLDAPSGGVDYTIFFGLVASIVPPGAGGFGPQRARVTLHSGEELELERAGDLSERNAGMLIFLDGDRRPEYVPWTDVERIDFDRPAATYPFS